MKTVKKEDVEKSRLGLGHTYSRFKVKFNLNKVDNMIIQSILPSEKLTIHCVSQNMERSAYW